MLKQKIFYHQNIPYSFNWNLENHKKVLNKDDSKKDDLLKLGYFLKRVYIGKIPNSLFNDKNMVRASKIKMIGIKGESLKNFSKKLIRSGKITMLGKNTILPNYAQKVYDTYNRNQFDKKPGHNPILKNILIKDKNSIAIEIPIWKTFNNNHITGHIDLIQTYNYLIKVIDYKPEGNFMYSLPQIAIYGLLLKNLLKLDNIKCISFNKEEAWEYDPNILFSESLFSDIKNMLIPFGIRK